MHELPRRLTPPTERTVEGLPQLSRGRGEEGDPRSFLLPELPRATQRHGVETMLELPRQRASHGTSGASRLHWVPRSTPGPPSQEELRDLPRFGSEHPSRTPEERLQRLPPAPWPRRHRPPTRVFQLPRTEQACRVTYLEESRALQRLPRRARNEPRQEVPVSQVSQQPGRPSYGRSQLRELPPVHSFEMTHKSGVKSSRDDEVDLAVHV